MINNWVACMSWWARLQKQVLRLSKLRWSRLGHTAPGTARLGLRWARPLIILVSLISLILWLRWRVTNYLVSSAWGPLTQMHVIMVWGLQLMIKLPILVKVNQIHQVFIGDGRQSKLEVLVSEVTIESTIRSWSSAFWTLDPLIILLSISSLIRCLILQGSRPKQVSFSQWWLFKGRHLVWDPPPTHYATHSVVRTSVKCTAMCTLCAAPQEVIDLYLRLSRMRHETLLSELFPYPPVIFLLGSFRELLVVPCDELVVQPEYLNQPYANQRDHSCSYCRD